MKKLTLEKIQERVKRLFEDEANSSDVGAKISDSTKYDVNWFAGVIRYKAEQQAQGEITSGRNKAISPKDKWAQIKLPVPFYGMPGTPGRHYKYAYKGTADAVDGAMGKHAHPDAWNPYGMSGWCGVSKGARKAVGAGERKRMEWADWAAKEVEKNSALVAKSKTHDEKMRASLLNAQGVRDFCAARARWLSKDDNFSCDGGAGSGASESLRARLVNAYNGEANRLQGIIDLGIYYFANILDEERADEIERKRARDKAIDKAVGDERARNKAEREKREQARKAAAAAKKAAEEKAAKEKAAKEKAAKEKEAAKKKRRDLPDKLYESNSLQEELGPDTLAELTIGSDKAVPNPKLMFLQKYKIKFGRAGGFHFENDIMSMEDSSLQGFASGWLTDRYGQSGHYKLNPDIRAKIKSIVSAAGKKRLLSTYRDLQYQAKDGDIDRLQGFEDWWKRNGQELTTDAVRLVNFKRLLDIYQDEVKDPPKYKYQAGFMRWYGDELKSYMSEKLDQEVMSADQLIDMVNNYEKLLNQLRGVKDKQDSKTRDAEKTKKAAADKTAADKAARVKRQKDDQAAKVARLKKQKDKEKRRELPDKLYEQNKEKCGNIETSRGAKTARDIYNYGNAAIRGYRQDAKAQKWTREALNQNATKMKNTFKGEGDRGQDAFKEMAECKPRYLRILLSRLEKSRKWAEKGANKDWPSEYRYGGGSGRGSRSKPSKTYGEVGWKPSKKKSKAGDTEFDQFYADLEKADLLGKLGKRKKDYDWGPKHKAAYRSLLVWASKNKVKLGAKPEPKKEPTQPKPEKMWIWCGDPDVNVKIFGMWNKNRQSMGLDPLRPGDCQEKGKAVIRTGRYMGLSYKEMKMLITGNAIEQDLEKRRPSISTADRERQILEAKEDALRLFTMHSGFTDEEEEQQIEQIVRKHLENKTIGLLDNVYARTHQMKDPDSPMTLRQMLNHEGSGSGGAESLRRLAQEVEVALSRPTRGAEFRKP